MSRLTYCRQGDWPPLAWLARCPTGSDTIEVLHGARIETRPDWYCEAVWDGDFAGGDFDETDVVFGSGGRLREAAILFVSAGSTLDRLHSLTTDTCTWVSNSLACLSAAVGAAADPHYAHYTRDLHSISQGLDCYTRELATSAGPVRVTYFNNLRWDGRYLHEEEKPYPRRDLGTFADYRSFLERSLLRIAENLASDERSSPYTLLGTLSSGYDSPAVCALARPAGLREAVCFSERPDSPDAAAARGADHPLRQLAELLGLRPIEVSRDAWREVPLAEVPFLVGDAKGMDVWLRGAELSVHGRVVLSGHHGDGVWSKTPRSLSDTFRRVSPSSGLSLTEYRLWAGFIHLPLPYLGARQVADINAITRSDEMAPWDIGGHYSRPIPRRIVEEAGVPRGAFATRKRGTSVWLAERATFRSSPSAADYLRWLHGRATAWLTAARLPPTVTRRLAAPVQSLAGALATGLRHWGVRQARSRAAERLAWFATREPAYRFMFPWALERAKARYSHAAFGGIVPAGAESSEGADAAGQPG